MESTQSRRPLTVVGAPTSAGSYAAGQESAPRVLREHGLLERLRSLDFTDLPLAENTDGRNSGPSLDAVTTVLAAACANPGFRVLSIGELNPTRAAGTPDAIARFIGALGAALR